MAKNKKQIELEQQVGELTQDLQRVRADFENYRKRVEQEKTQARASGRASAVVKLLPVIDNIERGLSHIPNDLQENAWAQGIVKLAKNLETALESMGVKRIDASSGARFNPEFHEAIQFDEDASGDNEVVAEELQAGYTFDGEVIRTSMVKVTRA